MDGDRLASTIPLLEIVALEHACHGALRRQLDHVGGTHGGEPFGIEAHFGLGGVEHLEDLFLVGLGVGPHLLLSERLARHVLAGGIADAAGEIADQENDLMAEILELTHLGQ